MIQKWKNQVKSMLYPHQQNMDFYIMNIDKRVIFIFN
jgi:hypothetical protein